MTEFPKELKAIFVKNEDLMIKNSCSTNKMMF